jgi:hypothetical protein
MDLMLAIKGRVKEEFEEIIRKISISLLMKK